MALSESRIDELMDHADDQNAERAERWISFDGVVIAYDYDDPPFWLNDLMPWIKNGKTPENVKKLVLMRTPYDGEFLNDPKPAFVPLSAEDIQENS